MTSRAEIGFRTLSMLARILPSGISYLLGETLGSGYYLLSPGRRSAIAANLTAALGRQQGGFSRTGFRQMVNFGRNVVEIFMLAHLLPRDLSRMVRVEGREKIDRVLKSNRGVILVTAHIGSWELGGAALAAMGYRITTVAGIQFNARLSPHVRKIKENVGINMVSSETGVRGLVRDLHRAGIVALHVDGDQFTGGIEVDMFGRRLAMPAGPVALALQTNAAILPAFAVRIGRRSVCVRVEDEIYTGDRDESAIMERIVRLVETYVRRYPDQWCMFRDLWEGKP
jgi:lauroyl/myristoyl acyltransferase